MRNKTVLKYLHQVMTTKSCKVCYYHVEYNIGIKCTQLSNGITVNITTKFKIHCATLYLVHYCQGQN